MNISTLIGFAAAFAVFAASPGPDNVTIVTRTIAQGAWSGLAYGAGTVTGVLLVLFLSAVGLSALAAKAATLMMVLRCGGAAYLVWMGVKLWVVQPAVPGAAAGETRGTFAGFVTGVALNLGNPKMPLFYLALLPSIVGPALTAAQVGALAAVIVGVEVLVIGGHVLLATRVRSLLRAPGAVRRVNRAAGSLMIGAGVTIIATR